jgi:hypothetical protein
MYFLYPPNAFLTSSGYFAKDYAQPKIAMSTRNTGSLSFSVTLSK